MRFRHLLLICFSLIIAIGLSSCSGERPVEKSIIGTWVQDTPISMTTGGLQTTTADTVLKLGKNGEVHLTRNLDVVGPGLPTDGVKLSVELRGKWEIIEGQLKQTQDSALIMPRTSDSIAKDWAATLQAQADQSPPSFKDIIAVDKTQLILQDSAHGTTDLYRRK